MDGECMDRVWMDRECMYGELIDEVGEKEQSLKTHPTSPY